MNAMIMLYCWINNIKPRKKRKEKRKEKRKKKKEKEKEKRLLLLSILSIKKNLRY